MSCGTDNVRIEPMDVYLGSDKAQVENITCLGSSDTDNLNNKYFAIYKSDGTKNLLQFNVNLTGTPAVLTGYIVTNVPLGANPQTAAQVATALATATDALAEFVATASGGVVKVTHITNGFAVPVHDGQGVNKTGFAFGVETVGDLFEKVGLIDGDIEIANIGKATVDIMAHQFGQTLLGQIETSTGNPELSFALKETGADKYNKLLRYSLGVFQPVAAGSSVLLGAGTSALFKNPQTVSVVLHPVRLGVADKSKDWYMPRAKVSLDSITFSGENIVTIPVTLTGFPDCDKVGAVNTFSIGDWSQTLTL